MMVDDADAELLKKWLIKKLEDAHAEADSDVLADYITALCNTDEPDDVAKANCVENLKDFLGKPSEKFVDEVFEAIATRSFDPSTPAPKPTAPTYQPPRRHGIEPPYSQNSSKKRTYHDRAHEELQNGQTPAFVQGGRPTKYARRGGRGGNFNAMGAHQQQQYGMSLPPMPTPPPGMPPIDPNNPMAAFMAMSAMGLMPGFPAPGERCIDYDTKGFCARGASCPFEHGSDSYVMPGSEYDPNQAALLNVRPTRTGVVNPSSAGRGRVGFRGRGGGSNSRGGGKRAEFSHRGPNFDRSITTIVVEQIPDDKFEEEAVREFFGEFGNIEEVNLQPYKKLATVRYDNYDSAKAAYDSPKVVFDNRFVKVYWLKTEEAAERTGNAWAAENGRNDQVDVQDDEPQFDPAELAKKQEEAQRKHEEQRRRIEEAESQKKELDIKMKAIEAERKKMAEALAKKRAGKASNPTVEAPPNNDAGETEQTKALRAQLAKLEAEAKSLGIDPEAPSTPNYGGSPYHRGRGGFRGRPRGRGGYNPSFRGGWTGARGGAVMRLDNRPRSLTIAFREGNFADNEGALRQWLLFNESESATLMKHPDRENAALLSFQERYLAEQFMAAATAPDFPLHGQVDLSWYRVDPNATVAEDAGSKTGDAQPEEAHGRDAESWDVADDDDRWG